MTKRTIIPLLIAALVALLLPWLAVTFAKGDNGMAVIFLLFFAVINFNDHIYLTVSSVDPAL